MNGEVTFEEAVRFLQSSVDPTLHLRARRTLEGRDDYFQTLLDCYLANPFLTLTEEESRAFESKVRPQALGKLIAARHAASRTGAPKYVVFCMPKSGSSFVKSALQKALRLQEVSLTGFSSPRRNSQFGINAREHELDEAALAKASLVAAKGFVAQHHTRYSQYLALQMRVNGLTPLVTVRNILDCIVSFDDMLMESRRAGPWDWAFDPQFALPTNYGAMEPADRYTILGHSFGIWLINFYLSWARGWRSSLTSPTVIRYEEHILNPTALVELFGASIPMSDEARQRLEAYVRQPDPGRSRFNVGRRGRGAELLPERLQAFLAEYIGMFGGELSSEEIRYLVR